MVCIFRRMKKVYGVYIRRIAGLLAGFVFFVGITCILDQMYVRYSPTEAWYRILWQQFYVHEGEIENLYLGSSHVFCDLNPEILDQLTGKCNFNLSSPNQPLNGSYYLLREADKRNELSHVYLEVGHMSFFNDKRLTEYLRNWSNTDYMQWSLNKAAYMLAIGGGADQVVSILFPYTRYREYLGRWDYITKVLDSKKGEDYRTYHWDSDWGIEGNRMRYCNKGFNYSMKIFEDQDKYFRQEAVLKRAALGERSKEYCHMVIAYCQKREIPITLYIAPINDLELISTRDYDDYVKEIREFAAKYDLMVYDFNLAKDEYLPLQDSKNFKDTGHLNASGANLFTPFFYQVVSGEETDNNKYFYDSYKEKLQSLAPAVYGAYYIDHYDDTGKQTREVWVASNRDSDMEYRITLTPDEGRQYLVQDFKENKEFVLNAGEHGVCTIAARMKALPDEVVQTMEIRY